MPQKINYIFADPESPRFLWQEENYIRNLRDIGVEPERIIVLNTKGNHDNSKRLERLFGVKTHTYVDDREPDGKRYTASIKPWLMHHYFTFHPDKVNDIFFYTDSDIVIHHEPEIPDDLSSAKVYGSDCNSYLGLDYINSKNYKGSDLIKEMADVFDLDVNWVKKYAKSTSIGAQYLMTGLGADYWRDVYYYSYRLEKYLSSIEKRYKDNYKREGREGEYVIQKWCAEMWATMWILSKYNVEPAISSSLDFAWSTWKAKDWMSGEYNILHNSGIVREKARKDHLFYKADFQKKSPYEQVDKLLSTVDSSSASYEYVRELKKTAEYIKNA